MFTGIIEAVGEIKQIVPLKNKSGFCLSIAAGKLDLSDVAIGNSIAVNGVCLTVTAHKNDLLTVDVSKETLNCTYGFDKLGMRVNLEKAMRLSDRLGGHLVTGHVDGTGKVIRFEPIGENHILTILAPRPLLKYIANKGSITINGVSLTVNQVENDIFSVNLIPHTFVVTTLKELEPNMHVNLETDILARYVARLIDVSANQT